MSYNYLIPGIACVLPGYDLIQSDSIELIKKKLLPGQWVVEKHLSVWHEGKEILEDRSEMHFKDNALISLRSSSGYLLPRTILSQMDNPGFIETQFTTLNGSGFSSNSPSFSYIVYKSPGKKSYLGDNSWKYATPPVINQIAEFGVYIDGCSVARVDRDKDYGESFILINPYRKTIIANLLAPEHRSIRNIKIPARSVRRISLEGLLKDHERSFAGQVQLTANNRLITYDIKHSLSDPTTIFAQEHLDPFRGDATHVPLFSIYRQKIGRWFSNRGITWRAP